MKLSSLILSILAFSIVFISSCSDDENSLPSATVEESAIIGTIFREQSQDTLVFRLEPILPSEIRISANSELLDEILTEFPQFEGLLPEDFDRLERFSESFSATFPSSQKRVTTVTKAFLESVND
ncbi:MAG: hypothetical protein WBA74_10990, partial [Cyclobacteriaceae bacterium]